MNTPINLSELPAPNVVEELDYETIFQAMLSDLQSRDPSFNALVESDPATKILEVAAYRELLLRQRVNDATRSVMLAYANKHDLDNLGALFGLSRHENEQDPAFRTRIQLAFEGLSTAGPIAGYQFHALSASSQVKDVHVNSPSPGVVSVVVLSHQGNGTPSDELLTTVNAVLSHEDVRPLTDHVQVMPAQIHEYQIVADLSFYQGPDQSVVAAQAKKAVTAYAQTHHQIGHDITQSGLLAALHQPGVRNVKLITPTQDLIMNEDKAGFCTQIEVRTAS
ncbi:baseplate assembly protein [Algicola sagamiensis]|uniref:baseplate assembly protein n=1 Tax=Algicola sagamiensis TaxID=163869 RepID=UPI00037B0501|nr:baseplate J/gp47 family protein [Algicola sagamiensis]